jgi:predicted small lipoprotein YifL
MKKFLAWLLACVMLLSLAACAKTQTPAEEPADAPAQQEKRPLRTKPLPKK